MKNSILLYRINLNKNSVFCIYIYFAGWFNFKIERHVFELTNELTMSVIFRTFQKIEMEYDRKYRI